MLGISLRELISSPKYLLYRTYILSIALYEFLLWFYNKASLAYPFKELRNMQWKAVLWILEAFWTSLLLSIKAITGLIPIYLYLQKLGGRLQLRTQLLPTNHIIKLMLKSRYSTTNNNHCLLLKRLTLKQQLSIKGPIVDANDRLNGIFNYFNPFSCEFSLENRLINIFSSCFYFHLLYRKNIKSKKSHICKLDKLILQVSVNPRIAIITSDISIKNQVAISITHIHIYNNSVIKMLYHTINVTSTKAKLFVIRCGWNQATQLNIEYIIVIMDSIHTA